MIRFDRYLIRRYLLGMLPVLLLLLILFSLIALTDELEDAGQGEYTVVDAFLVIAYTAPRRIVDLLPVTALLGGLLGLGAMANHQELIAARVAGLSRVRLAWPVLVLGLALALGILLVQSFVIPFTERAAQQLRASALTVTRVDGGGSLEFWTRSGPHFVRVNEVQYGRLMRDVEIFSLGADGGIERIAEAETATIEGLNDWRLRDVRLTTPQRTRVEEVQRESLDWPGLISAEQAGVLVSPIETLAPLELAGLIDYQTQNGLDTQRYRVVLWGELSIPVAVIGMALLALPLLLGPVRSKPASQRMVLGGAIGIGFYLLQQLSGQVANLFRFDPMLVLMAPAVLLLIVAVYSQFTDRLRRRRARREYRDRRSGAAA